jgi:hypothetical protein
VGGGGDGMSAGGRRAGVGGGRGPARAPLLAPAGAMPARRSRARAAPAAARWRAAVWWCVVARAARRARRCCPRCRAAPRRPAPRRRRTPIRAHGIAPGSTRPPAPAEGERADHARGARGQHGRGKGPVAVLSDRALQNDAGDREWPRVSLNSGLGRRRPAGGADAGGGWMGGWRMGGGAPAGGDRRRSPRPRPAPSATARAGCLHPSAWSPARAHGAPAWPGLDAWASRVESPGGQHGAAAAPCRRARPADASGSAPRVRGGAAPSARGVGTVGAQPPRAVRRLYGARRHRTSGLQRDRPCARRYGTVAYLPGGGGGGAPRLFASVYAGKPLGRRSGRVAAVPRRARPKAGAATAGWLQRRAPQAQAGTPGARAPRPGGRRRRSRGRRPPAPAAAGPLPAAPPAAPAVS